MNLEQSCEAAILEYAPYYKQLEALNTGAHADYIETVVILHKNHYNKLVKENARVWSDLPEEHITWLNENLPYTV